MNYKNRLWILILSGLISSCDKSNKSGDYSPPENVVISSEGDGSKLESYPKDGAISIDIVLGRDEEKYLRVGNGAFSSIRFRVGNEKAVEIPSEMRSVSRLDLNKPERFGVFYLENEKWKLKYANYVIPEVGFHMPISIDRR